MNKNVLILKLQNYSTIIFLEFSFMTQFQNNENRRLDIVKKYNPVGNNYYYSVGYDNIDIITYISYNQNIGSKILNFYNF